MDVRLFVPRAARPESAFVAAADLPAAFSAADVAVLRVDLRSGQVSAPISAAAGPHLMDVSPDGRRLLMRSSGLGPGAR